MWDDVETHGRQGANRGFAAGAGTLDAHLNRFHAVLIARRGSCGCRCLLRGVRLPLREPLKPIQPADDQQRVRPSGSVMVIIVLLNDAVT